MRDPVVPARLLWSSPFVRWGGALASTSSVDLAVTTAKAGLARGGVDASALDEVVFGWTVPQPEIFYGAPVVAARIGNPSVTGPMVSQACATSVAGLRAAAASVVRGDAGAVGVVVADRVSNGPLLVYPEPTAPGGAPATEHWVLDSFARDPWGGTSMVQAAENVAAEAQFSRAEIDDLALLRYEQYARSLADDRAFQRQYMVPVAVPGRRGEVVVDEDQGVHESTREGLAALLPVLDGGVLTHGAQTHPADGAAGCVVVDRERAEALGGGPLVELLGFGTARAERARMPKAPVPAARRALQDAGVDLDDVHAVTTHNPFAVNDLWFARETGFPVERTNQFGSSLVYGHPQGPTGMRAVAELVATLEARGGGIGLFTGCAAGDTGAAVVVRLDG